MRAVLLILGIWISGHAFGRIIIAGKDQAINTLSKAVLLARDGDTILLRNGIYKEGNIIIRKSICLMGEGQSILDGQNKHELLTISGNHITVKNIRFQNAGYSAMNDFAAIKVIDASYIVLENNFITGSYFAIHVSNTSFCTVRKNVITGKPKSEQLTGNGIHLWKCHSALVSHNQIRGHRDGIYFEFVTASTIQDNISEQNIRYGLHFMFSHNDHYLRNTFKKNGAGVAVMYSRKVKMEANHFEENWGPSAYGILLKEISDSYISRNTFLKNTAGIYMEGSSRIQLSENAFRNNGWAIKVQANCDDNVFHHNNFNGNSFDVATNGTMVLNKFFNNYWDKYDGYDLNKDGVGDIPYHPVTMYAMLVEQQPTTLMLMRSFIVSLMDKAEKAIPSLTPQNLVDEKPMIKPNRI